MNDATPEKASVSRLPRYSGDGYTYGGGAILTIGCTSIPLGEGENALALGQEIARRWNQEFAHD